MRFVFAVVEDEEIEAAFGEKKLVGAVHDALPAKVPEVKLDGLVAVGQSPGLDVDAGGFGFVGVEGVVDESFEECGFADIAFAYKENF